jgi:hypothetical protein
MNVRRHVLLIILDVTPTKRTDYILRYLYYIITLNILTRFSAYGTTTTTIIIIIIIINKAMSTFKPPVFFTPRQMCTKVSDLVLWCITEISFLDGGPTRMETCRII